MFFKLKSIVKNGKVLKNKSLKNYTSFKIGGKAKYIVEPSSFTELIELINYLNKQNCDITPQFLYFYQLFLFL